MIRYKERPLGLRYRVDFICYDGLLVELKALRGLTGIEEAQGIHYLTASRLRRGLLLNFGSRSLLVRRFVGPGRVTTSSVPSV